jgi:hypothetical protein
LTKRRTHGFLLKLLNPSRRKAVSAATSLHAWTRFLNRQLFDPLHLHGHLRRALAVMSFSMASAGHCHSTRVCLSTPGRAAPASARRRFERLLDNPHLNPLPLFGRLCRVLAEAWRGLRVVLIIDETDRDRTLRSLRLCVGYRKRVLPLLSLAYPPDAPPLPMPRLLVRQLSRVRRWLGDALDVTVLADRGLAWPQLVELCRAFGWHYVLRVQASTRVLLEGAQRERSILDVARPRPGGRPFRGRGRVFKKHGWLDNVFVTARWERDAAEPWLLISDRPGGFAHCRTYAKRIWCEQSFRDEKSGGFHWDQSRVDDPRRATRLLLVMALATLLSIATGVQVVKRGLRHLLDCHRTRTLSYFQLGRRWLEWITKDERPVPPLALSVVPP